jgi:hypothetical protein
MADAAEESFAKHAGHVLFPRTPADLTSTTTCPACFATLRGPVCGNCGLDLNHPAAPELAQLSSQIADSLTARLNIIGRIRFDTAAERERRRSAAETQRQAEMDAASAAEPPPVPLVAAAAAPAPATIAPPVAPPVAPAPPIAPFTPPVAPVAAVPPVAPVAAVAPVAPSRRRSSIQVLVLIAGVSLLSVAAVLFLVYAFINFGLVWRSVIIGALTLAAFIVASALRRRRYVGTAEGIAVFAIVLVYLDAYAVRANNLFGAAAPGDFAYWGLTLVLSAVGFIVWHRLSGLRVANVVGFAALAPGAGILVSSFTEPLDDGQRVYVAAIVMFAAALAHPLAARGERAGLPERFVLLSIAGLAALTAAGAAFTFPHEFVFAGTFEMLAVALVAAAHVVVAHRSAVGALAPVAHSAAALAAITAASAFALPLTAWLDSTDPGPIYANIVPLAASWVVLLALDTARHRFATGIRAVLTTATIAAACVAALPTITVVFIASRAAFAYLGHASLTPWQWGFTDAVRPIDLAAAAPVIALAIVVALFTLASMATRRASERRHALLAAASVVALVAVPLLSTTIAVMIGWLVLAAIAIAALIARQWSLGTRAVLWTGAAAGLALGYTASWLSEALWAAGSLSAIALVIVARVAVRSLTARASLLVLATSLGYIAATALAQQLAETATHAANIDSLRLLALASALVVALSSSPRVLALSDPDRRALYATGLPVSIVTLLALWTASGATTPALLPPSFVVIAASALTAGGLLQWLVLRGNRGWVGERVVASAFLAPVTVWLLTGIVTALALSGIALELTPISAVVLVAAGGLVATIRREQPAVRAARDASVAVVGAIAVGYSVMMGGDATWLVLVFAGVATLLVATNADGLFAAASPRKHLGWLALAFATVGLWMQLADDRVEVVEPYVLPLGGALLIIAVLAWRAGSQLAAPVIALGGLLVAIVPLAVTGATGALERPLIVGIASAVLLLGASLSLGGPTARRYLDAAAIAGAVGVLAVAVGRAITLSESSAAADARLDAWLGSALLVIALAIAGQTRIRHNPEARPALLQLLGVAALGAVTWFELANLDGDLGATRAIVLLVVLAVIHVAGLTLGVRFLGPWTTWAALVFSLAALAWTHIALTGFELASVVTIIALASSTTALVVTLLEVSPTPRWQREIGQPLLAALALAFLFLSRPSETWIVLVAAGIVALITAVSRDGLFASGSLRKHFGWLALALVVGGLWWRLNGVGVTAVEAYVLPLAGALLLVALLAWRSTRGTDGRGAAPVIVLSGLLVAVLPLALDSATGAVERAIGVGAASAVLLLVGSLIVGSARLRPYLDAAALSGAIGVIIVAVGRAWFIAEAPGTADARLDAWLGATMLVYVIAAFGQSRARLGDNPRLRSLASQILGIAAFAVVFIFEVTNLTADGIGQVRALAVVLLFCAVHVLAAYVERPPLTRLLAWTALGFGITTAAAGITIGALDPIEFATVPVALALLGSGAVRLADVETARTWPNLGPGLLVLFVPSMLALSDDNVAWRIAAIAVLAIITTIVGLVGKLQAPLLIGALVTIVHAVTTLAPFFRTAYEVNTVLVWIVIGSIGGTLLVVFAARFEKAIMTARTGIERVRELR